MDQDEQDDNYQEPTDWGDGHPDYRVKEEISTNEIIEALGSLYLLGGQPLPSYAGHGHSHGRSVHHGHGI
jgi:hypothetical protein